MAEAAPDETALRGSFLQQLMGVYLSPGEAFGAIVARPAFWAPLLAGVVLSLVVIGVWLRNIEPREFVRAQLEELGAWDRMPEERRAEVLEQGARGLPRRVWIAAGGGPLVVAFVVAGAFTLVLAFFMGTEVTFRQVLTVVAWAFLAVDLVVAPLTLLTLHLKGDWNLPPQTALQANLSLLLEKESTPRPLYALAGSVDLFSFWTLWLLSLGFAAASRRSTGATAAAVLALWGLWVVIKVGFVALIPAFRG